MENKDKMPLLVLHVLFSVELELNVQIRNKGDTKIK